MSRGYGSGIDDDFFGCGFGGGGHTGFGNDDGSGSGTGSDDGSGVGSDDGWGNGYRVASGYDEE
jgi:hypothetical protein